MTTRRTVLSSGLALAAAAPMSARAFESATERYDKAADYSEAHNGSALLVSVGGKTVYERYAAGLTGDTPAFIASAAKSFWGVAVAAAIEDGLIGSFDELAAATLTEWRGDPQKSQITLRQILGLTSGLHNDIAAIQGEGTAPDMYSYAVAAPLDNDPGTTFTYGPVNYYVLGAILKRKLQARGQDPLGYLDSRILKPIGLTYGQWLHDKSGNPHIPNGCYVAAREWVKFGRLLLNRGRLGPRQLVRADLLAQCFVPGPVNPGYGLTFWLNTPGGVDSVKRPAPPGSRGGIIDHAGPSEMIGALGAGPNQLVLIPSMDMAVVKFTPAEVRPADRTWAEQKRIAQARRRGYSDTTFFNLLLTGEG